MRCPRVIKRTAQEVAVALGMSVVFFLICQLAFLKLPAKRLKKIAMSNKGNCLDNAVMENFFGILKSELLYLQDFDSTEHFKNELIEYLDYYNNRHSQAKQKGLPPALHRQQALSIA